MASTREIGDLSEAMVIAALLQNGFVVLRPIGERQRYDLVVHLSTGFHRVQCKTGRKRGGIIKFAVSSSGGGRKLAPRRHYRDDADFFGIYCPETAQCYLVPVGEVGINLATLRVDPPAHSHSRIRIAADYAIHRGSFMG